MKGQLRDRILSHNGWIEEQYVGSDIHHAEFCPRVQPVNLIVQLTLTILYMIQKKTAQINFAQI